MKDSTSYLLWAVIGLLIAAGVGLMMHRRATPAGDPRAVTPKDYTIVSNTFRGRSEIVWARPAPPMHVRVDSEEPTVTNVVEGILFDAGITGEVAVANACLAVNAVKDMAPRTNEIGRSLESSTIARDQIQAYLEREERLAHEQMQHSIWRITGITNTTVLEKLRTIAEHEAQP